MIDFDNPSIAVALLAIIVGLRLALYIVERVMAARPAEPVAPVISPDDVAAETLTPLEDVPAEAVSHPLKEGQHPFRFVTEILDSAFIAVFLVFFLIRPFVLQAFFIPSESMVPTLQTGDKLLAAKFTYSLREPRHQEVVVFHAPKDALETSNQSYDPKHPIDYVKRVIGLPGDRVHVVANDGVYVNDTKLNEPYLAEIPSYNFPTDAAGLAPPEVALYPQVYDKNIKPLVENKELVVPPGYIFVLGDNRNRSHDSHAWGFVPRKELVGRVLFIFWPLNRMGFVH